MIRKNLPNWKGLLTVTTAVAANLLVVTNFTGLSYAQESMLMDYDPTVILIPADPAESAVVVE